ncbi:MAG: hypothetical protein J6T55_04860 [Alphaproteobacteria bacterium]|nr:hypothetical protein [Alphaproteobacteria bacterium]
MEKKIYDSVSSFSLKCGSRNWSCGEEPNIKTLQESGRSILEIIAILAVMSVITFGGFKGYEMVSKKMKMNAISSDLAALVKERQIRALDKTEKGADIRNEKIGSIPVHVQNGTPEDGDKEEFFWVDINLDKKEECEEFLYTDLLEPAFIAIDNSIPGECPGEIRLYYPKDPKDNISGIKTYVNPSDGKTYICYGDDCNQSNGGTYGLACRKGYMPNSDKSACEKIACASGTGFAGGNYGGSFANYANDGVTRCYCPTGMTFEDGACVGSGVGQCSGHGTWCGSSCSCNEGYYGTDCEYYNNCSGNGQVDSDGTCNCNEGYYGADCEYYNNCSGNGRVNSDGTCNCNSSYYGMECEYYNDCSGNGRVNPDGTCNCNDGYYGTNCEDEYCSGHGTLCGGYCSCDDGWYGTYCESEGASDPCSGHGTLDWAGRNYFSNYPDLCLCDKGYTALPIPVTGCDEELNTICSGNGRSNGCGCLCDPGYCGNFCQNIGSSVCNGGGRYLSFGNNGFSLSGYHHGGIGFIGCLCNDGTIQTGYNACASTSTECSGHGTLDWPGANHWPQYPDMCLCDKGYWRSESSMAQCSAFFYGDTHWKSLGLINGGAYVCDSGYYGNHCEIASSSICNGSGLYIVFEGQPMGCLCNDGTIQDGDPINGNLCATGEYDAVCSGHGTLDWPGANHWPQYPDMCLCDKRYWRSESSMAQCSMFTDIGDPDNHKKSLGLINGGAYVCDSGYYGLDCGEYKGSAVCNGNGQYIAYGSSSLGCLCNDGTIQEGYNACASISTECSGHGTLDWPGANYWSAYSDACLCDKGYYGADCSQSRSACYNHGQYSVAGCVCDSGYYGADCDTRGDLCNGNGQYIAFGFNYNNGSCLCNNGTIQTGVVACAPCSGHGIMVNGSCVCGSGWYGANCDSNCDGVLGDINFCYPCSHVCGFSASLQECAVCDNTSYPREVINGFCTLTKAGCDAFYPASGGFRSDNYSWCSPCSDANVVSNTSADACAECDGTNYPREIITNNGKNYCALTSAGCNTLYPEGWFRAYFTRTGYTGYSYQTGSCFSCSHSSGVPSTAAECNRCSNTLYPREMINDLCVPMTSSCDALYPTTGGFVEEVNGSRYCHSCSESSVVATTADACAACDNTPYPRKMVTHKGTDYCVLTSAACNALYPTTGGFGMACYPCSKPYTEVVDANACAACDNTPYPREMVPHYYYGEICAPSSATCHARGELRDTGGDCRSCNYSYRLGASAEESDFCMGTAYPRFMSDELSYPCSYSEDVSTTATECAKCDNSTTPRTMKDGKCVLAHDCSGHGTKTPAGQCVCNSGWYGNLCEYDCEGWKDVDGHCHSCNEKYAFKSSECGRCPDTSLYPREMDDDKCALTYIGCNTLYPTTGGFKSASGDCYSCSEPTDISTSTFECNFCPNRKMYDNFCKLTLTCSGHGKMTASGCSCDKGYDGTSCENVNPNACFGHGTVTNGACVCFEGYYGTYCEGPTGCSGNGTITNSVCVCNSGWYVAQCDSNCDGIRSYQDDCRSCSYNSLIFTSSTECDKCSNRVQIGDYCFLTCNAEYPTTGGFRKGFTCYSCSYEEGVSTSTTECAQCENTSYPRFMDNNSTCYPCSHHKPVPSNTTECAKCNNTSTPREMVNGYCALKDCPEGEFKFTGFACVGLCFPCSTDDELPGTPEDIKVCKNTESPRFITMIHNGSYYTYPCSYQGQFHGSKPTAEMCAQCDGTVNPRFMSAGDECYSCAVSSNVFAYKDECDKCGNLRYHDGTYCRKK